MPKFSFVMPTRREGTSFIRAVNAILGQTEKDIELILCNTNPNRKEPLPDDPRVKVINDFTAPDTFRGAVIAENKGYDLATGDLVCSAGDDDFLMAEYAEVFINAFKQRPHADIMYSNYIAAGPDYTAAEVQYLGKFKPEKMRYHGNYLAYAIIVMRNNPKRYDETYETMPDYKFYLATIEEGWTWDNITVPLAFIRNRDKEVEFLKRKLVDIVRLRIEKGDNKIARGKWQFWLNGIEAAGHDLVQVLDDVKAILTKRIDGRRMKPEKPASYYDDSEPPIEKYQELYEKAAGLMPPDRGKLIYDLGCGGGRFAAVLFAGRHYHYCGFDFNESRIQKAKELTGQSCFWCKDILDGQMPNKEADVYVLLEVLEHIEKDRQVLRNIPSGTRVVFSVPNFMSDDHVRCFSAPKIVEDRYQELLDFESCKTIERSEDRRIFLFDAVRK